MTAKCQLPQVGDGRRDDQQRRSLRRQHSQAEQPHGHGGQSQADHAFDGAGQQKGADHQQRQGQAEILVKREEGRSLGDCAVSMGSKIRHILRQPLCLLASAP